MVKRPDRVVWSLARTMHREDGNYGIRPKEIQDNGALCVPYLS